MPRARSSDPRNKQLLLRLTAGELELLESVPHLERKKPNSYAREVLVDHLQTMSGHGRVRADLENRQAYDEEKASTTSLRGKARRRRRSGGPPDGRASDSTS